MTTQYEPRIVMVFDTAAFLKACGPCQDHCQHAKDVGMPEARCAGVCQYTLPDAPCLPN